MRNLLVLSVCLALVALVSPAFASSIPVITTSGDATFACDVDTSNASYDVYTITLATLTGGAAEGGSLALIEGTWTATGGSFYTVTNAASTSTFKKRTSADFATGTDSYVNLGYNSAAYWGRDGAGTIYTTYILGGWYTTDSFLYVGDTVAVLTVTKGTTKISFGDGTYDNKFGYVGGTGGSYNVATAFSVSPVPEPSTLALLGAGLVGLAAYAWRKRK